MGGSSSAAKTTTNKSTNISRRRYDNSYRDNAQEVESVGDSSVGAIRGSGNYVAIEDNSDEIASQAMENANDALFTVGAVVGDANKEVAGIAEGANQKMADLAGLAINETSATLGNSTTEAFQLASGVTAQNQEFLYSALEEVSEGASQAAAVGVQAAQQGAQQVAKLAEQKLTENQTETETIKRVVYALAAALVLIMIFRRG